MLAITNASGERLYTRTHGALALDPTRDPGLLKLNRKSPRANWRVSSGNFSAETFLQRLAGDLAGG